MANFNCIVLIGRLTRDIDLNYTSSGTAVGKFALAVNSKRKQGDKWIEEANFFDIVLFGKTAENLSQYLVKGKEVAIGGELKQSRWKDKNGDDRNKIEVICNNIQLLSDASSVNNYHRDTIFGSQAVPPNDDKFDDDIPF